VPCFENRSEWIWLILADEANNRESGWEQVLTGAFPTRWSVPICFALVHALLAARKCSAAKEGVLQPAWEASSVRHLGCETTVGHCMQECRDMNAVSGAQAESRSWSVR